MIFFFTKVNEHRLLEYVKLSMKGEYPAQSAAPDQHNADYVIKPALAIAGFFFCPITRCMCSMRLLCSAPVVAI